MNEKMSFEEAKKFWRWKWKQIGIKVMAILFGVWVAFSFVGFIVFIQHLERIVETPIIYSAFATSTIILLIVAGVVGVMSILVTGEGDK